MFHEKTLEFNNNNNRKLMEHIYYFYETSIIFQCNILVHNSYNLSRALRHLILLRLG